MRQQSAIAPALTYLFDRLEERFNGNPTLLLLDEAWLFLDNPMFSGRIRDWLKTLRKKNVSVIFATQSLSDVQASAIAPAIIESIPAQSAGARVEHLFGIFEFWTERPANRHHRKHDAQAGVLFPVSGGQSNI